MSYSDDFWKHIYYSPDSDFFPFDKNSLINWVNETYVVDESNKFTNEDIFNKELIEKIFGERDHTTPITDTDIVDLVQACKDNKVDVSCKYYQSNITPYNQFLEEKFASIKGVIAEYNNTNNLTTITFTNGNIYEYGSKGGTCALHKNCNGEHLHYNNCELKTITNANGESMCQCMCSGGIKMSDGTSTHTHCGILDKDAGGNIIFTSGGGTGERIIKTYSETTDGEDKQLNVETETETSSYQQSEETLYKIYAKYYYELYRNKYLNNNMNSSYETSNKAVKDAKQKYKKEYVQLFNYITGILFVSGYVYFMYNEKF